MPALKAKQRRYELPAEDPRSKLVLAAIKKNQARPDSLIQILHVAQSVYGYLPMNVLGFITHQLKLVPSRVYGVVTFYHFFSLKPKGEHTCLVCTGTACYVKGAQAILEEIDRSYHLAPGQVSADNRLGIQTARCLGACGLAPAVVVDDEVLARVQPGSIQAVLEAKLAKPT
jgi:bidirectional [NiFe] hydrogenase diaphorase subunit